MPHGACSERSCSIAGDKEPPGAYDSTVNQNGPDLQQLFEHINETLSARFKEAGYVKHKGDRGTNREVILREFLKDHLPRRYGIAKGEILTRDGDHSHSADIIVFDALNCPVLYSEDTAIVPIEGVYGVIEVKSRLSKEGLVSTAEKLRKFKELAPRDLSVIETREYMTVLRPSRPFGIVFAFDLADNSLSSLRANWEELNTEVHDVDYFVNLIAVMGAGLLYYEHADLSAGKKSPVLDTDAFVELILKWQDSDEAENQILRIVEDAVGSQTFGRFFVLVLLILQRMRLNVPDLGRYLDPDMPFLIHRES